MRVAAFFILGMAVALLGVCAYNLYAQTADHYPGSSYFPDCSSASVHDHDIGFLAEYGITQGYPDGTYRPGEAVSREQMASYIMRQTVADWLGAWLIIDDVYFDGYYFGNQAYQDGRITWEEYQALLIVYDWMIQLMDYQASAMASQAAGDSSDISPSAVAEANALRAILATLRERQAARAE